MEFCFRRTLFEHKAEKNLLYIQLNQNQQETDSQQARLAFVNWGPFQTSNFSCAEPNANQPKQRILLINIRFGTLRRLN